MIATALGALALLVWAYLLLLHGGFWRTRPEPAPAAPAALPPVAAIVPARDEAELVGFAVASLLQQNYAGRLSLVLVDDHSSDATQAVARAAAGTAADRLTLIAAKPLPAGWTGKLWAVQNGLDALPDAAPDARWLLLSDADIEHDPDNVAGLVARAERGGYDLVSLMVRLRCESWAERALVPAFVFFFMMLYPFAWVSDPKRRLGAAAGGCMLVRRAALERVGGMAALRGALIDDCALGQALKRNGPIWLGLADKTRSLRIYGGFRDIWQMVARSAYAQLRYSPLMLLGCILGMALVYLAPPAIALFAAGQARWVGLAGWAAMSLAFLPTLRYYRRSPGWAPALPLIALFYVAATLRSAFDQARGRGGSWKGRMQAGLES
jgi:hopene-associated glycosyltransferase HpnB